MKEWLDWGVGGEEKWRKHLGGAGAEVGRPDGGEEAWRWAISECGEEQGGWFCRVSQGRSSGGPRGD